tara:strand:+ start:6321 stop:7238 length:918 start_codon:yes stop_codon:yes gene_type:complete
MKISNSEITPYNVYLNRRKFIKSSVTASIALSLPQSLKANHSDNSEVYNKYLDANDQLNKYSEITSYNNFYEFYSGKGDPAKYSKDFKPSPWTISFDGLVHKPRIYDLDEILKKVTIEDRVYRLRCVEAWSMVIPWQGFLLSNLIKIAEPLNSANFVQFETIFRPSEMPAQNTGLLPWPYTEALRMDEAMHPLTILSTGLYGHKLPNQNGAPLRLVVPWKYGFKSIKSITKINFLERRPVSTWQSLAPHEYGFYSNVNPNVDHPRWSQSTERRIGEFKRRKTLMFNGYEKEVSYMYKDLDLKKFF